MQDRASSLTGLRPGEASRVGAELARARERLGVSIADAAAWLRIKSAYLEALEAGAPERLPGSAYAVAFLRSYSRALGLDPDQMADRYKATDVTLTQAPRLAFLEPAERRGVPAGAGALLAAMLAVGAYAGWYHLSAEGRLPPETVPPVPQRLALLAEPPRPQPPEITPAPAPSQEPAAIPQPIAPEMPAQPVSPTQAAAATTSVIAPAGAASTQAEPATTGAALRVHAVADSWLQVRDREGHIVFSRIMRAGEDWPVPDRTDLLLTTGNAGGTEIVVDGMPPLLLGTPGAVRRDLPLDPEQVKASRLAPLAPIAAAR